jgi:hypothetical protein
VTRIVFIEEKLLSGLQGTINSGNEPPALVSTLADALGGSRKTDDGVSQTAFISHRQTLSRANFEREPGVIDNLDDQRPLAGESPDSVENIGENPFREFSSGKS